MNIPANSAQGPTARTDYQSLYAAPSGRSTFLQTTARTQSSSLSLTTAEGDLVTLSDLSLSYQQTKGVGWFTPASSGVNFSSLSATGETMGLSVQGDLNEQELADITRLVGELTSIASAFFSGDYEGAMAKAVDFGGPGLGSISSLSASFSSQTVTQTRITSHYPLPAMEDLNALNIEDPYQALAADSTAEPDHAELLEARWQQILKALDEMKELDGLIDRMAEPQPAPAQALAAAEISEEPQPPASDLSGALQEAEPALPEPSAPAEYRAARQMMSRLKQLLTIHPKLTPFVKALAATAMENAATRTEQPQPADARAFGKLRNAFRDHLQQWFFPPEPPAAAEAPDAAI